MVEALEMPKARGPVDFTASKWQPDVAQPQLATATYLGSCVKLDYYSYIYKALSAAALWLMHTYISNHLIPVEVTLVKYKY